jgi:hypothetical protein
MDRGQIDAAGHLAEDLRITTTGLQTSRPDTQGPHQCPRHHTNLVPDAQGGIRNPKRLAAGLDHDAALRAGG